MKSEKSPIASWLAFVSGGLLLAWLTGKLTVILVPDSPSYLQYPLGSLEEMCRSIRTFGVPLWLKLWNSTFGLGFVPAAQVIVHATAVWWLFRELAHWNLDRTYRIAIAITAGVGCTANDLISTMSSDALAASLGVMVVTAVLRWARQSDSVQTVLPIVLLASMTIFVRPAYLFLGVWLLIAGALLRRLHEVPWRSALFSALKLSVLLAVPVLTWMGVRKATVDDFGFLPFGHQNMGAILVQLVSDEELQSLPGKMGSAVVIEKDRFDKEVGFAKGEAGATMTIDSRWDDMTYHVVIPAAISVAGDDPIASHRAVANMNRSIISRYPLRYIVWLVKSARRGAWAIVADITMHPIFLLGIGVMVLVFLQQAVIGNLDRVLTDSIGLRAFTIITFTYLITKLLFVILTSPAIGRFSDAAAIFLPGWIAVVFLRWLKAKPRG